MTSPTSPDTPAKPKPAKAKAPEQPRMTAAAWAGGDHPLLVPLAGLLAAQPELKDSQLTSEEWQAALDKHGRTERSK